MTSDIRHPKGTGPTSDILAKPPDRPLVLASILAADFARLGEEVADVLAAGADAIHVDIMDGRFVPNLTMGPALLASLRKQFPDVFFDVHLMVEDPRKFVEPFIDAGADNLSIHVEPFAKGGSQARGDARKVIDLIHSQGCKAGIVINPPTPAETVMPLLAAVDLVLVMSVNPGFSGQEFMSEVLTKAGAIKAKLPAHVRLEMDGGINVDTAPQARQAGVDMLVAANAIFHAPDRAEAIKQLRGG